MYSRRLRWAGAVGLAVLAFAAGCGEGREEGKEQKAETHEAAEGELSPFDIGFKLNDVLLSAIAPSKSAACCTMVDLPVPGGPTK